MYAMPLVTPLQIRIKNQLKGRIGNGLRTGDRVNEAEIANDLGVSRTPVRQVLRQLADEGFLTLEPRRGFVVSDLAAQKHNAKNHNADVSIVDFLDERMMRDMALGKLIGIVSERALKERYKVSNGVLLSTLRRLMRDRLVEPSPGRGWIFTDVGPRALAASYRFRQIVEPSTILSDGYAPDEAALRSLDAEHAAAIADLASVDRRTLFELDARFHELVARGADTPYLAEASQRQSNIRRVNEYIGFIRLERIRSSMEEHRGIMAALLCGQRQVAAALMCVHLQVSEAETFEHIDKDLDLVREGRVLLSEEREAGNDHALDPDR